MQGSLLEKTFIQIATHKRYFALDFQVKQIVRNLISKEITKLFESFSLPQEQLKAQNCIFL
jgi:hypothetical protein